MGPRFGHRPGRRRAGRRRRGRSALRQGEFIARGIFNSRSRIQRAAVHLGHGRGWTRPSGAGGWSGPRLPRSGWATTIPQGAARLVFSEGDGLSGLIVDRYGEYLAVQATALAMAVRLPQIVPHAGGNAAAARHRAAHRARHCAGPKAWTSATARIWGRMPDGPVLIREADCTYEVDLAEGQKTGFYLDQRENRRAAAGYLPRPAGAGHVLL